MTTTNGVAWVDRRAARDTAAAARVQADAAVLVAAQQAADLAADRTQRHEVWQEQRRDRRTAERATRRAARTAARKVQLAATITGLPRVAELIAYASPTVIATRGQLAFAQGPMQLGGMALLFPAMLEGAAWTLAWRRHQAIEAGDPDGRLATGVWTLALLGAGMNYWHGAAGAGGPQVGAAYALASLVGFVLVELRSSSRRAANTTKDKLGLARWFRYLPITFAAWSYRVAAGTDCTWTQAWAHAWVESGRTAPKPAVEQLVVEQDEELGGDTTEPTPDPADQPELVALVQPSRMRTWTPTSRPTTRRYRSTRRRVHTLRPRQQQKQDGEQPKTSQKPQEEAIADRVAEGAGWPTINSEFFGKKSESRARAYVKKYQHLRTTTEAEEGQA